MREVLNSSRFQDCAVRQVYATLLDEATYLCSWRTMYRILAATDEVRERREQLHRPSYTKPELSPRSPERCGVGTLPSSKAQPSGPTTICM